MPFRVKCVVCDAIYELSPDFRGREATCACGVDLQIPAPETIDEAVVYPAQSIAAAPPEPETPPPNIHSLCPFCSAKYDLPPEYLGQEAECAGCGKTFTIQETPTPAEVPKSNDPFRCRCPKCHAEYALTAEYRGLRVECAGCGEKFSAEPIAESAPAPASAPPPPPENEDAEVVFIRPSSAAGDDDRTMKMKRPGTAKPRGMIPQYNIPRRTVAEPEPAPAPESAAPPKPAPAPEPVKSAPAPKPRPVAAAEPADDMTVRIKRPGAAAGHGMIPQYNVPKPPPVEIPAAKPAAPAKPAPKPAEKKAAAPAPVPTPKIPWWCFWKRWANHA